MSDVELSLRETLRPIVAELVALDLEQRLAELRAPDWLTLEEAAERYRTSADALRKRAQRSQLPGAVRDGSRWLLDRHAFERSIAATISASDNRGERRENGPAPARGKRVPHAR